MASRPLTEPEASLVLSHLTCLRDRALFVVALRTGYRVSELLSLTIDDVTQYGRIRDTVAVKRRHMKGKGQGRSVVLHPEAKAILAEYVATGVTGRLFAMTRQHAHRLLRRACEAAQIEGKVSMHSFRKAFGQRVYQATGNNIVAAQRALGHLSLSSTTAYLSVGQDEVDRAILGV